MVQVKFLKEDILKDIENISSVIGANRSTDDGNIQFDRLSMTGDDAIMFNTLLLNAWHEIWRRLNLWIIDSSMRDNILSFTMKLQHDNEILNNEIKQFLVSHILGNWFMMKGIEDAQVYLSDATLRLDNITMLLRKKLYDRKSSPF